MTLPRFCKVTARRQTVVVPNGWENGRSFIGFFFLGGGGLLFIELFLYFLLLFIQHCLEWNACFSVLFPLLRVPGASTAQTSETERCYDDCLFCHNVLLSRTDLWPVERPPTRAAHGVLLLVRKQPTRYLAGDATPTVKAVAGVQRPIALIKGRLPVAEDHVISWLDGKNWPFGKEVTHTSKASVVFNHNFAVCSILS